MSNNLNLLRESFCGPVIVTKELSHSLFPLERECEEGKAVIAKAPVKVLTVQEFDPSGLAATYRDETTGAELPVFAVFNLEGSRRCHFEISAEAALHAREAVSLANMLPLEKSQPFVRQMNAWRIKADRLAIVASGLFGFLPGYGFLLSPMGLTAGQKIPFVLLGGWLLGAMAVYIILLSILDRWRPWKKLVISAEFNGLLPKEARQKALEAKGRFDNLYLIVDQQNRWQGEWLPDPAPRGLDPLLIGEISELGRSRYYLIHQFDLTGAEQYLADEFAVSTGSDGFTTS